jgi:hypothetical protein
MQDILNIASYRFVAIADVDAVAVRVKASCERHELKGTVLVSPEGINIFLAGTDPGIHGFLTELQSDTRFDGIAVKRPAATVTDADVDAMVQNLREQRPRFDAVERASREGDRVTMDFAGQIDGAAFEGSKGDDVAVLLGGGRMLKDFEAGVTGLKLIQNVEQRESEVAISGLFLAIGHTPNTDFLRGQVEVTSKGYVRWTTAARTYTSVAGVFAAGDVADDYYRQAITSAGTGCMAALDAELMLAEHGLI